MKLRLPRLKPVQWLVLGGSAIVVVAVLYAVLVKTGALEALRHLPVREWVQNIAGLGPGPFLLALAILPAFGAPVSLFYLIAGTVFEEHGGLGMALAGSFAAITVNAALSYSLGRWVMHPVVERIVRRFGWKVPKVRHEDRWIVTLLMRITPGPPLFAQNYLLALGGVPFGAYMLVSVPVLCVLAAGVIVVGESLVSGSAGKLLFGVLFVVAAIIIVRIARRRISQRRPEAVAEMAGENGNVIPDVPPSS